MKELLKQFAAYHIWANQRLTELILSLPEELHTKEVKSSFPSLHLTLLHMWNAESVWWQRVKLNERFMYPTDYFKGNTKELVSGMMQQSKLWEEWISSASDLALDHVFQYMNFKKEQVKQPVWRVILHVMNHGTYHRGQLVTMLRQLGIEKIPQTDFTAWALKLK